MCFILKFHFGTGFEVFFKRISISNKLNHDIAARRHEID